MGAELHIHVHQDAEDVSDIVDNFPLEEGQTIIAQNNALIIIDLGEANDTSYVQEWYLNGHEGVASFYIVDDDPAVSTIYPEE
jgi:hypothetical protein